MKTRQKSCVSGLRHFDRLSDRRIIDRYYNRSLWFVRSLSLWFDRSLSLSKCTNHQRDKATETENAAHNRGTQITYNEYVRLLSGTKFQTRRSRLWLIASVLSATGTANSGLDPPSLRIFHRGAYNNQGRRESLALNCGENEIRTRDTVTRMQV